MTQDIKTVWLLWKCDDWRRWTTVKGGPLSDAELDGKKCQFSGCRKHHVSRIVGESGSREFASKWFRGAGVSK